MLYALANDHAPYDTMRATYLNISWYATLRIRYAIFATLVQAGRKWA